jgi:hypothetical protein
MLRTRRIRERIRVHTDRSGGEIRREAGKAPGNHLKAKMSSTAATTVGQEFHAALIMALESRESSLYFIDS